MRYLILKLLGLDEVSIQSLKSLIQNLKEEIIDLQTTISSLKSEATAIYEKTEEAFIVINQLNIDKSDELWWEKADLNTDSIEVYKLARNIKEKAKLDWIRNHPSLKEQKIFHGGCIGCVTPLEDGIGKCMGCKYAGGWHLPDLSRKC